MNGLNLESFLRLIRADLGAWASLGLAAAILAVMTWTSWGSRRALRKCLFLSIAAHVGLIVYGGTSPEVRKALRLDGVASKPARAERPIRITPWVAERPKPSPDGRPTSKAARWDLEPGLLTVEAPPRLAAPAPPAAAPTLARSEVSPIARAPEAPEVRTPIAVPSVGPAEARPTDPTPSVAEVDASEVAGPVEAGPGPGPLDVLSPAASRLRPGPGDRGGARSAPGRALPARPALAGPPRVELPAVRSPGLAEKVPPPAIGRTLEAPMDGPEDLDPGPPMNPPASPASPTPDGPIGPDPRRASRPSTGPGDGASAAAPSRSADGSSPQAMARVTPTGPATNPTAPRPTIRRSISDVPPVYRSRLDPDRTSLAQRAGASLASEQAVERALDWLARHQDADDGRWDGATARVDGVAFENDDSFTIHCPAGEVCFGECVYWDADTALTGLSLLAYLGAGYTHVEGKYESTVAKGLEFLLGQQKADGDLRGQSRPVGMYCHSMATLALVEAYALTGDPKLRGPVERALGFLVRARSRDGMAWRYSPGSPDSDTSILGWAVMALKSGKSVGIPIPPEAQSGMFAWLKKVSKGPSGGLAFYTFEPKGTNVTPTMTAEAWACRQFLEVGGPGPASDEAAQFLLRNRSDRGEYNIYYLYYGTLAMYQHGGEAWSAWNARVRDDVVARQRARGHMAGSWDPDDSPYGHMGGRIYGTALATLTLEVYYRFLRLYEPSAPSPLAPRPGGDAGARRTGLGAAPPGR